MYIYIYIYIYNVFVKQTTFVLLFKLITTITDQLLVISFMKVKKSKVNYIVLF